MKILHRFLLRRFLAAVALFFVVFSGLYVLIEFVEIGDTGGGTSVSFGLAATYIAYRLPYLAYFCLPIAVLVSSIFTLAWRAHLSETVAARSAGISTLNYIKPIVLFSLGASVVLLLGGEWLIPAASDRADNIKKVEIDRQQPRLREFREIAFRSRGRYVLIDRFVPDRGVLERVSVITPTEDMGGLRDVSTDTLLVFTESGTWLGDKKEYDLPPPKLIEYIASGSGFTALTEKPPEALRFSELIAEYLSLRNLRAYTEERERISVEMSERMAKLALKSAFPLTLPFLAILGSAVGMTLGRRRGIMYAVSGALACTLVYVSALQMALKFSDIAAHTSAIRSIAGLVPFGVPLLMGWVALITMRRI